MTGLNSTQIAVGAVLVKADTPLPEILAHDWRRIGSWLMHFDGARVEQTLREVNWHFFYVVPSISARAIAFDRENAVAAAFERLLLDSGRLTVNALEITAVKVRHVLGIHFAQVAARPRHVRPGPYASDPRPHQWLVAEPIGVQSEYPNSLVAA